METGRDVFNEAKMKLEQICGFLDEENSTKQVIQDYYVSHYYKHFEHIFNHYFRNLYHIFKYIDESSLISDDKTRLRYSGIVRAQLSQNELYTIMFNFLIQEYGYPKFLLLDTKYNVLANFRHSATHLKPFYELYIEMRKKVKTQNGINGIMINIENDI